MGVMLGKSGRVWAVIGALAASLTVSLAFAQDNGVSFRPVVAGACTQAGPQGDSVCLQMPLVAEGSTTALDVLREIYPGLDVAGMGNRFAGGDAVEAASDPEAGLAADRAIDISTADVADIAVLDAGERGYAAVVSGGIVAVAEIRPAFKPLGRLLVATDPGGPTHGFRLLLPASQSPVAVTVSSHFNSQERYESMHVVGVVGGALVDLYDGPYLYSVRDTSNDCELLDHQEVVSALHVAAGKSHHGLSDVDFGIDATASCLNGETLRQIENKSFPVRLIYDGVRYDGDTSALDAFNAGFEE